jgi:hypothetical protein
MTPEQAKEQIERLLVAYPGYRQWINEYSNDPVGTMEVWIRRLQSCNESDVTLVVDQMINGDLPLRGERESREALIDNVKSAAQSLERERKFKARYAKLATSTRERRYDCPECLDRGLVEILHPAYVMFVTRNADPDEKYRLGKTCVVSCSCDAGEQYREGLAVKGYEYPPLREYNKTVMCKFDPSCEDDAETIETWRADAPKQQQTFEEEF